MASATTTQKSQSAPPLVASPPSPSPSPSLAAVAEVATAVASTKKSTSSDPRIKREGVDIPLEEISRMFREAEEKVAKMTPEEKAKKFPWAKRKGGECKTSFSDLWGEI
ncbi:hypothetical protein F5Y04DRAFT_282804 [Hypomontagnella monticulosa]|nr:hypothetical protein F5Y04DRAFT_282804 [Hypomontagnella monticulosa]